METIRVTSHLDHTVRGRYDGKDYDFVPEEPTFLSLEAAQHIFGLGEEDKMPALNKLGFLIPGKDTLEQALEKLDQFTFDQGRVTFDAEGEDVDPGARAAPKRTGGRRPHAGDSGGVTAAGSQPSAGSSGGE
jgi:hypothetical protein